MTKQLVVEDENLIKWLWDSAHTVEKASKILRRKKSKKDTLSALKELFL